MEKNLQELIMEHEPHVSLDTANLLKQAGFDWNCQGFYKENVFYSGSIEYCSNYHYQESVYAKTPSLYVAQRWLREVKRIFITVSVYAVIEQGHEITDSDKFSVYAETWDSQSEFWNKWSSIFEIDDFNTYELALEAGIKRALEIILEKGE